MNNYKAHGIVLHSIRYGETSLIVYVLTDCLGRQNYLIQGVGNSRARGNKGALFQPMFILEYEGLQTRHSTLHRMKDIRLAGNAAAITCDVRKSTISLFMAEVLYRLVRESEQNSALFNFVSQSMQQLERLDKGVPNFHLWFIVQLSYYMGFFPSNEYVDGNFFDIIEGRFVRYAPTHRMFFESQDSFLLNTLMNCEADTLDQIALTGIRRNEFLTQMMNYLSHHFDIAADIRSIGILREVF